MTVSPTATRATTAVDPPHCSTSLKYVMLATASGPALVTARAGTVLAVWAGREHEDRNERHCLSQSGSESTM